MPGEYLSAPRTLSALFERQAGLSPDTPAVRAPARSVSYAELDLAATGLASRLADSGVGPEDVVGVRTGRGVPLLVALLGVLKAGAAYLALPRDLPGARLSALLDGAGAAAVVTVPELRETLPPLSCPVLTAESTGQEGVGHSVAPAVPDPAGAAYVIYTSGSTGAPKGVVVEHHAAAAHVTAMAGRVGVRPGDGVLQMAGESFDVAVEQMFLALSQGATLVLRGDEPWGPAELRAELARGQVTIADLPTALFGELVTAREAGALPRMFRDVRTVLVGGEAFPLGALRRWQAAFAATDGGPEVLNAYGPTETVMTTTVGAAGREADREREETATGSVPVGMVVGPRHLYLLDQELREADGADGGASGELYVGGDALARGYLGRPDLTAERFVPDPAGPPGARMYRTGDRMSSDAGRVLTFLGRVDDQVKVRGFRIEPGEVEAALTGHPVIGQAAVAADGDRLVAYLVSAEAGSRLSFTAIREWLGRQLPQWMVPAAWTWLERLPVTASGKVDRAALPPVGTGRDNLGRAYQAPETDTERLLCAVWSRVLNVPQVGAHDDFFELGGTSLLAARALADVRTELDTGLALHALFARPTPHGLAALLDGTAAGDPDAVTGPALPPLTRGAPADRAPLSLSQRQVWVAEKLSPGSSAYNAPTTLRLHGALDLPLLERALGEMVRRHEILRTTVEETDGEPWQRVHPPYPVRVPMVDLRAERDPQGAAEDFVRADIGTRFDISQLPLIRWTALRLTEQTWELVLVEHHLIHDGWSFALLVDELSRIYTALHEGHDRLPPEPEVRYQDYARWQREALDAPGMRGQLDYWRRQLDGAPQRLELPYDSARATHDDTRGAVHRVELPAELCARLREFSREQGVTLFSAMLAGFSALLHRYSGQDEVCVGSAFGNRGVPGTADVLGMFVNPVVLRCPVREQGETAAGYAELVRRSHRVVVDAQARQELPFVELIRELDPPRAPGRNPLFQAMLNFDDSPLSELRLGPVAASYLERNNGTAKLDLSVLAVPRAERQLGVPKDERDHRVTLIWEYRTDLFLPQTIARLAQAYTELLDAALRQPERPVAQLPAGAALPGTAAPARSMGPPATVPELFAAVASRRPADTAVTLPGDGELSYHELDRRSAVLAGRLAARGVGRGDVVALHLPRSLELVVAVLGVLRAGAAYLPLDVASPAARIADVLTDAVPSLVLTARGEDPGFDVPVLGVYADERADRDVTEGDATVGASSTVTADPADLAYLIYTSGSTGKPKGVAIPHRGLVDKYRAWEEAYGLAGEPAAHLQMASVSFDVCTGDIFRALLSGGQLVLCPADTLLEPARLLDLLREQRVEYAEFLPSVFRMLVDHVERTGTTLPAARLFAVGGEAWSGEDYRRFVAAAPSTRILNVYGVTEATVGNTFYQPDPSDTGVLPVGGPLPGVRAVVLDTVGRPVPPGVVGEIHLGGTGLARGYHADPARTAARFVPDPDGTGDRLYATGDLARYRPDGAIEFLGRGDQQVKIRGFRVEPAEVEQALREHPAVAEAVVVARTGETASWLAGYYTLGSSTQAAESPAVVEELRDWLRARLPAYLVPSALVPLAALPRTSSGKVDRRVLPEPEWTPGDQRSYTAPRDDTERAVAEVWQQVLGVERVGVHDDFFDLGGHSLLAVRLVARMRAETGLELGVRELITAATVAGIVERASAPTSDSGPVLAARTRRRVDPALFDQQESAG